ncbi:MAG: aminoacyl-tRNA hydrolase [Candidatus Vogelbacteria bacterium]|nr:aminoacyl-tRNA hydrolase [Candidatus Vogelbacteria bacterium]
MAYLIAGLGNPGEEYVNTRHNTGRIILELVRKNIGDFSNWKLDETRLPAGRKIISKGTIAGKKVILVMPDNFMNNSGGSLKSFIKNAKDAENFVVIHDDLDLPIGAVRMSFNRGSGGHRGVESIIKNIKTEAFVRIRIGIATETPSGKLKKPKGDKDVEKFILGEFKKPESDILKKVGKKVSEAIVCMLTEGMGKAMSVYNRAL